MSGSAAVPSVRAKLPAWRVIWRVIHFQFGYWLVDLGCVGVVRLCWQIGAGLVMRTFFDLLAGGSQVHIGIWSIAALFAAVEAGQLLGSYGFAYADVPLFGRIAALLRKNLLRHILQRPGASPLPDSPGEAISRFRGDVLEIAYFSVWINDLITGWAVVIVAIVVMLRINATVTLIALAPFLLIGVIANVASRRVTEYRRASREAAGHVTGFIGEVFGAVQAVKVAAAERGIRERMDRLNQERQRVSLRERLFSEILDSIYRNTANLGTGLVLILVGQAMRPGAGGIPTFTMGDLALFVYFLESISNMVAFTGTALARYKQIGVSVERMLRLMEGDTPEALIALGPVYMDGSLPAVDYAPKQAADCLHTLDVRGLSYRHPASSSGIGNINLHLERGTFTVITGRIGSGKTTLLRALLGLLPPDGGEVRWNGRLVADLSHFMTPPRVAYTAQVPRLFSNTLRNNILMGLDADDTRLMRALRMAVLEDDLAALEQGLETAVGPKGVKLSGGQVQRTAAARMFVREPELLVFDDLSSALDVETEKTLWEQLLAQEDASPTYTCLAVSSRRATLRQADQIVVLKQGHIDAVGRLEELLETCPEMQHLWRGDLR